MNLLMWLSLSILLFASFCFAYFIIEINRDNHRQVSVRPKKTAPTNKKRVAKKHKVICNTEKDYIRRMSWDEKQT